MRKSFVPLVVGSLILSVVGITGGTGAVAAGASTPSQGVTATTIRVGIPYVDLAAVRQFGITLDQGSFPDAYNALIANLNAQGGVNGRHLVPYLVAVNPVGTGPAITACTQLAEDDAVFVAINPQQSDCFLQQHHVPTIAGSFQSAESPGGTPNFTVQPPLAAYDPVQLSVFAHRGVFKGKKVGLFAGRESDAAELQVVQKALKTLGVHVTESAVDDAPPDDQTASNQQVALITQRFQQAGVNEVVAVGMGSTIWPEALADDQSTYSPPWIATSEPGLETAVLGSAIASKYLKNVVTSSPVPSNYEIWHTPAVQKCDSVVRKAYPALKITPPTNPLTGSDQTFYAVEAACINLALFTTIAKAAGKNLTQSSFTHAGYGLKDAVIPGAGTPVSLGPGRAYAIGPVYLVTYDAAQNVLQFAGTPAAT
jgi:hypothetical protein